MQNFVWRGCIPACVVGVRSLVNGSKEMPSVALLWGVEELGKPAHWLHASLLHGRNAGLYISKLEAGEESWVSLPWGGLG